jgi:putative ABC transport system substrate-binding protein
MNRREVIVGLCSAVVLPPVAALAQQPGKVYRVGIIFLAAPASDLVGPEPVSPSARAFVQGLRALGYVEGQNLIVERRSAEGRYERFGDIVAELVGLKADVLVTVSDRLTLCCASRVLILFASGLLPSGHRKTRL